MNPGGYSENNLAFIIMLVVEISIGLLMDVFIIFVICWDLIQTKSLSSTCKFLVCLAISNLCFAMAMSLGLLDFFFSLGIFPTLNSMYIYLYVCFFNTSLCAWLTSSLACFYFIKILHFESEFFSWVKKNINSIVPWMLLGDLLASVFNGLLSSLFFIFSQTQNTTLSSLSMVSALSQSGTSLINTSICNSILPFLVAVITTLCTIGTLKNHRNRMKNVQISESEHLRSYEKVVWRMTQSLFFYGIFYAFLIILYFVVIIRMESGFWILLFFLNSFNPLQSVILVLVDTRLRSTWKAVFLCGHLREMLRSSKTDNGVMNNRK